MDYTILNIIESRIYQLSQYIINVLFYKHLFLANITPSNRPRSLTRQDVCFCRKLQAEITAAQAEFTVGHLFLANITPSNRPRSLAIQAEITAVQDEFIAAQAEVTGRVHQNRPRSLRPRSRKAEITVKRLN